MVVYARSDVSYIAIPADGGGCGRGHGRPVLNGAPVKIWALACPLCEQQLHFDPLWAVHPDLIPRTPDEERSAKRLAEEGTGTMRQVAEALALNAAKILHEHDADEALKAAEMARHAEAAESERRAAEAERLRAETNARLAEANRVAQSYAQPAKVASAFKAQDSVEVDIHPSRKCKTCGLSLTRKSGAAGRWPNDCMTCKAT
jgi:hypothetical protein